MTNVGSMKILHATESAGAGTLSVLTSLAHQLSLFGSKQMVIYSERSETPSNVESLFPTGVEFAKAAPATGSHLKFVASFSRALATAMNTWRPDVVHLHSSKAGFVGRFVHAATRSPCRLLYSPHGLSFLDPDRPLRNRAFKLLEYVAARTGAVPVGCGRGEAQLLTHLSGREACLLENPVAERFFAIERTAEQGATVVTVGRLSRQKAPEKFAAVARAVRAQIPAARFIWVGDGDAHYKAELHAAGCEVTGWLSRDRVGAFLASADVYLQTSRWEGLPISVMEALAAGVPCVVNDCVGNRDAVAHGTSGFVARSEEHMAANVLSLIREPELRQRMSIAARSEALRRFGPAAFASHVADLYEGVSAAAAETPECMTAGGMR